MANAYILQQKLSKNNSNTKIVNTKTKSIYVYTYCQTTHDLSSLTATNTFKFTSNQWMNVTCFSPRSGCWQQMTETMIRTAHRFKQEYRHCDKKKLWHKDRDVIIRGNAPEFQKWGPRSQVCVHTRWLKMVPLNSWGRVFLLVFSSNYRTTTHSFRDITTGQTTDTDGPTSAINALLTVKAGQQ